LGISGGPDPVMENPWKSSRLPKRLRQGAMAELTRAELANQKFLLSQHRPDAPATKRGSPPRSSTARIRAGARSAP
jgi:hypothetical protein